MGWSAPSTANRDCHVVRPPSARSLFAAYCASDLTLRAPARCMGLAHKLFMVASQTVWASFSQNLARSVVLVSLVPRWVRAACASGGGALQEKQWISLRWFLVMLRACFLFRNSLHHSTIFIVNVTKHQTLFLNSNRYFLISMKYRCVLQPSTDCMNDG
jgi:hypothetical protein